MARNLLMNIRNGDLAQVQEAIKKTVPVLSFVRKSGAKEYLTRYGIDLREDRYKCAICGRRITKYEEVGMLISNGKEHILICDRQSCIAEADLVTIYDRYIRHSTGRSMETSK